MATKNGLDKYCVPRLAGSSFSMRSGGIAGLGNGSCYSVLVVEDNEINATFLVTLLKKLGHAPHLVRDGAEAVNACKKQNFDVVLMDVRLPTMDGMAATEAIRAMEAAQGERRTPIVAVTAHAMRGDRERFLDSGMDAYISKPLTAENLVGTLNRVLPS